MVRIVAVLLTALMVSVEMSSAQPPCYPRAGASIPTLGSTPFSIDGDLIATGDSGEMNGEGAVHLYSFDGVTMTHLVSIHAIQPFTTSAFGKRVLLKGDVLLVGARDAGENVVFVLERLGGDWFETARLTGVDAHTGNDGFGSSLDIENERLFIGATRATAPVTQADAGGVYVYSKVGATWTLDQKLVSSDGVLGDDFGNALDARGDLVVVAAVEKEIDFRPESGSVYLFELQGGQFIEVLNATLPNRGEYYDRLGESVVLTDSLIIAGMPGEDVVSVNRGAIYIWNFAGSRSIVHPPAGTDNGFSMALSPAGDFLLVDSNPLTHIYSVGPTGISYQSTRHSLLTTVPQCQGFHGDLAFNSVAGVLETFHFLPPPMFEVYGSGCPGSGSFTPTLELSGCAAPTGTAAISIRSALGGSLSFILVGTDRASLPMAGTCELLVSPLLSVLALPLFGSGAGLGEVTIIDGIPESMPYSSYTLQAFVIDAGIPSGYSSTNGVQMNVQ